MFQQNTGYYEDDQKQLDRSKITLEYYKNKFFFDFLIILCYLISRYFNISYLKIIIGLKFFEILSLKKDLIEHYQINQRFSHFYTLISLLSMLIYVAHICGCIFHKISMVEINNNYTNTWLVVNKLQNEDIITKYINCLYFSIITMFTVGYGDITPIANSEKIFIIFMTLLGSLLFAYIVNTIGSIFQELAQKEADFNKKKYEMSIYMRSRQITNDVQVRVMKYLGYLQQQNENNPVKGKEIFDILPSNLREEIMRDFYLKILKSSKIFTLSFSQDFLKELSLHFQEKVCGPGEIVYEQNNFENPDLYYIQKGQVDLFVQTGKFNKLLNTLKNGDFLSQMSFFNSQYATQFTTKCVKATHLLILKQNTFMNIIKDFPNDFESYSQIKDQMRLYNINEHTSCISCGKYNHNVLNCHFIHYKKRKELIIARHTHTLEHKKRKKWQVRSKQREFQTLKQNDYISLRLKQLRASIFGITKQEQNKLIFELNDRQFFKNTFKIKQLDGKIESNQQQSLSNFSSLYSENYEDSDYTSQLEEYQPIENNKLISIEEEDHDETEQITKSIKPKTELRRLLKQFTNSIEISPKCQSSNIISFQQFEDNKNDEQNLLNFDLDSPFYKKIKSNININNFCEQKKNTQSIRNFFQLEKQNSYKKKIQNQDLEGNLINI
ncbi:hypothetical protein IMG5_098180 [Ichthyophthirius multifiliis]|uniref:Cyclic nucleotide-binding domain-containing protein n=1 Tax=Ichthyophthirius multifiliis TaxID=5932 RepID=G0QRW2_ICHMU|nr:hypothetical protein IMG5_098180 [Ichthyophthirius multifiliis]EGR31992.1 hypothetical protein IMG5_098180 [Ichthyophthirius multifiliis]|eukprot:XP_004035478.1 hypothetical protein IMG5_098180 [Ichthyophthirius multifiliis]